uniref:Uncharacterized protein n=1 Tax=Siphoviridae sp. ctKwY15 TaxID=2827843 RepID=A0A8S5SU24_9CAUD|nr:MAG TPA: hypothetical protein [Siphoviridae sp. ctKwY15]
MKLLKLCKQMHFSGIFLGSKAIFLLKPISNYIKIKKAREPLICVLLPF